MYAQLLFLSLLSSVILLHALEHRQWRWWVFYAFVVAAACSHTSSWPLGCWPTYYGCSCITGAICLL